MSQVILNLLNNAFDAIENKDEKWVEVQTLQNKNWVEIRVSDCGHGIPKEIQDKILQPFFTTKEVGKGTGLGLSISKGIIESHGGDLTIDNEAKNTTFVARIPLEEASVLNAA